MALDLNRTQEPGAPGQPSRTAPAAPKAAPKADHRFLMIASGLFVLALLGIVFYSSQQDNHLRKDLAANNELLMKRLDDADGRMAKLESQLTVTQDRVGVTQQDLERAREIATQLRAEQERNVKRLTAELAEKASSTDVNTLKETATAHTAQLGSVSENVGAVKTEVGSVKSEVGVVKDDLKGTKEELDRTKKDLANTNLVIDQQGKLIATNAEGLDTLRMKGEREYVEFDIVKKDKAKQVADIRVELRKADTKKQHADIRIFINDTQVDKGKVYVNEPVHVRQGRQGLDYEVVINQVLKDQIRGYLSLPKNKTLAVNGPKS